MGVRSYVLHSALIVFLALGSKSSMSLHLSCVLIHRSISTLPLTRHSAEAVPAALGERRLRLRKRRTRMLGMRMKSEALEVLVRQLARARASKLCSAMLVINN